MNIQACDFERIDAGIHCRRCGMEFRWPFAADHPLPSKPCNWPIRKASERRSDFPCFHRGELLRTQIADSCGWRGHSVEIRRCTLHGDECAVRKLCSKTPGDRFCNLCADRTTEEPTPFTDLARHLWPWQSVPRAMPEPIEGLDNLVLDCRGWTFEPDLESIDDPGRGYSGAVFILRAAGDDSPVELAGAARGDYVAWSLESDWLALDDCWRLVVGLTVEPVGAEWRFVADLLFVGDDGRRSAHGRYVGPLWSRTSPASYPQTMTLAEVRDDDGAVTSVTFPPAIELEQC